MNRKPFLILVFFFFLCSLPSTAVAILTQIDMDGDIIVYDDLAERYWVSDLGLISGTLPEVGQAATELEYARIDDWAVATDSDFGLLVANIEHSNQWDDVQQFRLFNEINIHDGLIGYAWLNSSDSTLSGAINWVSHGGLLSIEHSDNIYNTWVISATAPSIAPVPEPATMLLLGTGLVGIAGIGRKKFFKK